MVWFTQLRTGAMGDALFLLVKSGEYLTSGSAYFVAGACSFPKYTCACPFPQSGDEQCEAGSVHSYILLGGHRSQTPSFRF